ncbi:metalloenzyme [Marinithermofilum abyssi]|uniref:Metalloenzyme n=1 Tax=Marinithermofilum abyssi TaxID=1571185 RepID=A0A8J2VC76_9BACL|nr:metalloenzyme [Marinithermofilum abyssi]
MAVVLLFIDGVGLGEEQDHNPWFACPTPHLEGLLGGRSLVRGATGQHREDVWLVETDARLGVPGLPQSATGQAAIFTGKNAPKLMGEHQSGLPFQRLRRLVRADNLYLQCEARGYRGTFANCYTQDYFDRPSTKRGWVSVSTVAIQSAQEPIRMMPDLLADQAVYHDLTRWTLARKDAAVPEIQPEEAAEHLLSLAATADLVVHEYFLSDLAGHRQDRELIRRVIQDVDRFIGTLAQYKHREDVIVLVSDHGNSEDFRVSTHTSNPVPTLIIGPADVPQSTEGWNLTCITPWLLEQVERDRNRKEKKGGISHG